MENETDVVSFVAPLYRILGVVGLAPFSLRDHEKKTTWRRVWSFTLSAVLFSMLLFRLARLLLWETHLAESSVQWVPTALHLLLAYSTTITSLLIAATNKHRNGIQQIFTLAKSLDEDLQRHVQESPWRTLAQIVIISLILLPISVTTVIVWQDLWPPGLTSCDIFCFLTNTLLVMQFVKVVCIFQTRNLAFNSYILSQRLVNNTNYNKVTSFGQSVGDISSVRSRKQSDETEPCKSSSCMKVAYTMQCENSTGDLGCISFSCIENSPCSECQIQKLRYVHLNLYDLSNLINETFGYQILLSLASFFNFVLLALNFGIDLVGRMVKSSGSTSNGYYVSMIQEGITVFWGLWAATCTAAITVNCHHAAVAAENSVIAIHRATLADMPQEKKQKLDSLLLQVATIKVKFVAAGFFIIDLSLLHAIVAVMCTYLVVIFQLRT